MADTSSQILQRLLAAILARSPITDTTPGPTTQLAAAFAAELAAAGHQIEQIVDEFFLATNGARLDERGAQIPGQPPRLAASPASGSVLQLTRDTDRIAMLDTIEPGALVVSRNDDPSLTYTNDAQIIFPVGTTLVASVRILAQNAGNISNAPTNTITGIQSGPDWITSANNTQPLANGLDQETDTDYRARLVAWLASLARCQPSALEALALSYQTPQGARARYAALYEDLTQPGYSELVVDDGSAGAGGTRSGATTGGTVPASGALYLYHEAPATRPIDQIKITRSGAPFWLVRGADFLSFQERGIVVPLAGVLEPGDVWEIGILGDGSQYQVFTGLPALLQEQIEGSTSTPATLPGWRAAGTRVVVRPARPQLIGFDVQLVSQGDTTGLSARIIEACLGFLQTLRPGQTFYPARLVGALVRDPSVVSARIYQTNSATPMPDTTPSARDLALRTEASRIQLVSA